MYILFGNDRAMVKDLGKEKKSLENLHHAIRLTFLGGKRDLLRLEWVINGLRKEGQVAGRT